MNSFGLLIIVLIYLAFLFLIAQWAERKGNSRWTNNPYVYSLSLAVYCTAWTYYGSIGVAADSGLNYLPIYLGPVIAFPAWIVILKKIVRISRVNKISSIADFISLRYGNSRFLGAFVTVIALLAILPYIGLQLKAISETFHIVTKSSTSSNILYDTSTYVALLLAIFASYYGTRYVDASEKRKGMVTAVAVESILKLFFFILLGVYVSFFVFDGFQDIYNQASVLEHFDERNSLGGLDGAMNWMMLIVLSFLLFFYYPDNFTWRLLKTTVKAMFELPFGCFLCIYYSLISLFIPSLGVAMLFLKDRI
jgi:Na+/proline symporter